MINFYKIKDLVKIQQILTKNNVAIFIHNTLRPRFPKTFCLKKKHPRNLSFLK